MILLLVTVCIVISWSLTLLLLTSITEAEEHQRIQSYETYASNEYVPHDGMNLKDIGVPEWWPYKSLWIVPYCHTVIVGEHVVPLASIDGPWRATRVYLHRHECYVSLLNENTLDGKVLILDLNTMKVRPTPVLDGPHAYGRCILVTDRLMFITSLAQLDAYTRDSYTDPWKHVTYVVSPPDAANDPTYGIMMQYNNADGKLSVAGQRTYTYDTQNWEPITSVQ